MSIANCLKSLLLAGCLPMAAFSADWSGKGPFSDEFDLTLAPGHRKEFFGPFYYSETLETQHTWAIPPLTLSHVVDPATESEEFDFAYPLMTYDRFGSQYRWQFFQLWSFAGGKNQQDVGDHRFTLFPIYFQQRSADPSHNYTALVPFYGHLDHRLFKDEIDFVLFPLYAKTRKRDVITYDLPYPIFHLRHGDGLEGWQFWPLAGHEHKVLTMQTNGFGDAQTIAGHDTRFVLWPFFTDAFKETGTESATHQQALIPFYAFERSATRDSTSYLWPLGVTHTIEREKQYHEWDAPWPFVVFARGEGKTTSRIWPFFSQAHNATQESDWYLWLVYKYNRFVSAPLDRDRTRILYFLYSDVHEKNTETGHALHRVDFWPFFTFRRGLDDKERLQVLAIIEPVLPNNKSIERDYSPIYALWRSEKNPKTGAASQSLLWNLYRRDSSPQGKKCSLLFGLFRYESTPEGAQWRICYIPLGKRQHPVAAPATL